MKRLRALYFLSINSYGLGISFLWNSMHTIILPALLLTLVPYTMKGTYLGAMSFVGLLIAMFMQPFAGALSDLWGKPWGRRRPWMVIGACGACVSLLFIGFAPTYLAVALSYFCLQACSNLAHGAFQGLIPDLIPHRRRGTAAGAKNLLDILGLMGGVLLAGRLMDRGHSPRVLAAIVAVLALTMLVTLLFVREPHPASPPADLSRWALVRQAARSVFRFDMRRYPTYTWLLIGRFLVLAGVYAVQGFSQYYVRDVLHVAEAGRVTARLLAVVGIGTAALVYPAGYLSDLVGRRLWNVLSAALCGLGVLLLLTVRTHEQLYLVGAVLGVGLGSFMSVNWALATDLVPAEAAGKYLGLSNLATAGAGAAARLHGPLIDLFNAQSAGLGYSALFLVAGVSILLGALVLWRKVRDVPATLPAGA